ncbi:MAG: hypothetical protein WC827_03285 [Candidatus Paceibacterota bacterium]|jgi:hypothetical protein
MNSQKKFVILCFDKAEKPGKPGQTQLQSFSGDKHGSTLYLVDHRMSAIPEQSVREGVHYYCGINGIIGENQDRHFVVTVSVIESIEGIEGGAFWDQTTKNGKQWQYRTTMKNFDLMIVVDRRCQKVPSAAGQFWSFDIENVVSVVPGSIILSAELLETFPNEHKWRKVMKKRAEEAGASKEKTITTNIKEEVAA